MFSNEQTRVDTQTVCLAVLATVAVTFSIYWLRPVLMPLVVALFVVSGISPVLGMLEKRLGVTRLVAAAISFLVGLVAMAIFGLSIWVSIIDLSSNAQDYRKRVREIVDEAEVVVAKFVPGKIATTSSTLEGSVNGEKEPSHFVDALVRDGISRLSQALIHLVSTSIVVLIYIFFLLIGTPTASNHPSTVREIDQQVRSYLSLKTVISIFTGLAFGVALRMFGVPMAFTFGVLAFLLNFVPNIGPIVACVLPVPLIVLDPDGSLAWMIAAIAVTSTIQLVSGNFVEPKIMGDSSDLHPVTILVALMFWGMMWGVIGMFLATPITAAMKILLERIEWTRPIAALMSGRWEQFDASELTGASDPPDAAHSH